MSRKWIQCEGCEASYEVKHDLSENHYEVTFCVFCGEELEKTEHNQDYLVDEDEDDWGTI